MARRWRRRPCDDDMVGALTARRPCLTGERIFLLGTSAIDAVSKVDMGCGGIRISSLSVSCSDGSLSQHVAMAAVDVRQSLCRAHTLMLAAACTCCIVAMHGIVLLPLSDVKFAVGKMGSGPFCVCRRERSAVLRTDVNHAC